MSQQPDIPALSLLQLNFLIKEILHTQLPQSLWISAELSEGRTNQKGHFLGELIEKDPQTGNTMARAKINIWANNWQHIKQTFYEQTKQHIKEGMQLKLKAQPTFHEQYGYSLNITDIQPIYTLAGQEMLRQQILQQLEQDGILQDNKILPLPTIIKNIALISATTAAGYQDFCHQLKNNPYKLGFNITLFSAILQGKQTPQSIMQALSNIEKQYKKYDIVCIVRGGGASNDLSYYDNYPLAALVAQFPLPILIGIGHERDKTVLDYVAHSQAKTPTAAAEKIISHNQKQYHNIQQLKTTLQKTTIQYLKEQQYKINTQKQLLYHTLKQRLQKAKNQQILLKQNLIHLDPQKPLKRGYAIIRQDGKIITQTKQIKETKNIQIQMQDNTKEAKIIQTIKK